jgi:uncharacterized tellurite resistance protein B-like protein
MFADLISRLTQPEPAQLPDTDARLALTALLVRIARSDGRYDAGERARILSIVESRYRLSRVEAEALRADAEALEGEAPDTVRVTRAIKDAIPLEERIGVIEAMWAVVLDDGRRHGEEDALMRLVASLLGITDQDSNAARLRVAPQ